MRAKTRFGYYFSYHFKECKTYYLVLSLTLFIGLIAGIILNFTTHFGNYILSDKDQYVFDFITHDGSILNFFYSKALNSFVAFILIFVSALSYYSSFLVGVFFVYQGLIFSASCCQIIALYKLMGIVNVFVLLIPINAILFALLIYFSVVCVERAYLAKKYNISFKNSFGFKRYYWREIILSFVSTNILILVISILYSIVLRSVSFVVF